MTSWNKYPINPVFSSSYNDIFNAFKKFFLLAGSNKSFPLTPKQIAT